MDTLTPREAGALQRRWWIRNSLFAVPVVSMLLVPLSFRFGFYGRLGIGGFMAIHMASLIGAIVLGNVLSRCPRCRGGLGLVLPAVCEDCRTVLLPGSPASTEILARLGRPRVFLSEPQLAAFLSVRKRVEWTMAGFAVAAGALVVGGEMLGLDSHSVWTAAFVPLGALAVGITKRSLKCPNCGEQAPLDSAKDCRTCGAVLSRGEV